MNLTIFAYPKIVVLSVRCSTNQYLMIDYDHIYTTFIEGDLQPFYQRVYPRLISYATRILGPNNYFLAEDCVQDAVLKMYLRRNDAEDVAQWRAWLIASVRNNAIMKLRKDELNRRYLENELISTNEAEDIYLYGLEMDIYAKLFALIDTLPQTYRELFNLSFEQGLKNAEIAKRLDIAEITVKKRKARLIAMLRQRIGDDPALLLALYFVERVLSM